jgi:amino acid adenylation domain-containing protein
MSDKVDKALSARLAAAKQKSVRRSDAPRKRPADTGAIPLSSGQNRLWYLAQIEADSAVYNLVEVHRLIGALNAPALAHALGQVLQRHEVLRTELRVEDETTVQVIRPAWDLDLEPIDFSGRDEAELLEEISKEALKPFSLSVAPLFRWRLYKRSDDEHVLALITHHAITDGISMARLLYEAGEFYRDFTDTAKAAVDPVEIQYADYAVWQRDWLKSDNARKQLEYWVKLHNGEDTPLDLPLDYPRPNEQSYAGSAVRKKLDSNLLGEFESLLNSRKSTVFRGLLCVLSILLQKYSRQESVNIAVPSSGRGYRAIEHSIGYFANTLVYHREVDPDDTFTSHLSKTRNMCLEGLRNQDIPFDQVVNAINPPRDISRTPLHQVFLGYQDKRKSDCDFGELRLEPIETEINVARTDITLWADHEIDGLSIALEFCTDLFTEATATRFLEHFEKLIRQCLESPESPIWQLSPVTESDRRIQFAPNNTARDFAHSDALSLVLEAARRHPDKTAVSFEDQRLSYSELVQRAVNVAELLEENQIAPGSIVGIYMERSPQIVDAILGIWMAGCAYLPLDPEFPSSRLQYMVDKSEAVAVLSNIEVADGAIHGPPLIMVEPSGETMSHDASALSPPIDGDSLGYVIFTSGSTGQPKGVLVSQRAIANFLQSMSIRPGFSSDNRLLAVTTLSFDISVLELLLPLTAGGSVVIASKDVAIDASRLSALLETEQIDTVQATPATWKMLLSEDWRPSLDNFRALCGGEAMPENVATGLIRVGCQLWNMYGPTETTVWSTCGQITDDKSEITLGEPIHNTQCYVADARNQLCPVGVPGELLIAGDGLSNGYIGESRLTQERFVDLFIPTSGEDVRAYKTGDIVVRAADGSLLYRGRNDNQIKLRGFRIETGDIETSLVAIDGVTEAAVMVKVLGASDSRLQAFIRFEKGTQRPTTELRRELASLLPAYMIPQQFIPITEMPLTANGKVDRMALDKLSVGQQLTSAHVDPVTEVEKRVAEIWAEALQADKVSIDKCFFDIGGHSLLAISVIQRMNKEFGIRIGPREMMLNTLQQIAKSLQDESAVQEANGDSRPQGVSTFGRLQRMFTRGSGKR